jgi:hypothetical protein
MKIIKILETAWLVIAILAILIGSYMLINGANQDALYFYAFTVVAGAFYFIRRKQRLRMEIENKQKEAK